MPAIDPSKTIATTQGAPTGPARHKYAMVLPGDFSMVAFSCAVDAMRGANKFSGSNLYSWHPVSAQGGLTQAQNGLFLDTVSPDNLPDNITHICVCGGSGSERYDNPDILAWLRKKSRQGVVVGAISDGTFILGRAGLLDGVEATIHWQCHDAFLEAYPDVPLTRRLYEISKTRFTCAGGEGVLDMFLKIIADEHGRDLSVAIAETYIHAGFRHDHSPQRIDPEMRHGATNSAFAQCITLMEENAEEPLKLSEVADQVGISMRQMQRLFQSYVKKSPGQYYVEIRLRRAAALLEQTKLSVAEIAAASGFVSSSHLSQRFGQYWGIAPTEYRKQHIQRSIWL